MPTAKTRVGDADGLTPGSGLIALFEPEFHLTAVHVVATDDQEPALSSMNPIDAGERWGRPDITGAQLLADH